MVRELRALGYFVVHPDDVPGVDDELSASTCGCGCYSMERVLADVQDPRARVHTSRYRAYLSAPALTALDYMKGLGAL